MPKLSLDELPEVFVSTSAMTKMVSRYQKEGRLRKLTSRLYTKNLKDSPELIVRRNLWPIVGAYFPGGLIADRTAIENQPASDGSIFLISAKKREVVLPGIILRPRKGAPPLPSDRPFIAGLYVCSQARAFLENMKPSRSRRGTISRTLSISELEERLDTILRRGSETELNRLRDEARIITQRLGLDKEFKQLEGLIGALLRTRATKLSSAVGMGRQMGFPYDPERLDLFQKLYTELMNQQPIFRLAPSLNSEGITNLAFFEAYFSNFIEGTEFEINEAIDIIFKGRIPKERPEDAHDILGTFKLVSNSQEISRLPTNFELFITLLKERHAQIMGGRPDKLPGQFKITNNRAGTYIFVKPELILGTLQKGFEMYQGIDIPFYKAVFMMFLVAEVHPFTDGNGRAARVMMNAELIAAKEQRIIVPTIYRNNYLSALKALSQSKIAEPLIRMLDFAQKYTSNIDFSDFNRAQLLLEKTHAFMDPNEAEDRGIRLTLVSPGLLEKV